MKISINGPNTVKLIPENQQEKENLEALWKIVIRCDADSKVLLPIGSYVAHKDEGASFSIQDQKN